MGIIFCKFRPLPKKLLAIALTLGCACSSTGAVQPIAASTKDSKLLAMFAELGNTELRTAAQVARHFGLTLQNPEPPEQSGWVSYLELRSTTPELQGAYIRLDVKMVAQARSRIALSLDNVSAVCFSWESIRERLANLHFVVVDSLTPDGPLPREALGPSYFGTVGGTAWSLRISFNQGCLDSAAVDFTEKNKTTHSRLGQRFNRHEAVQDQYRGVPPPPPPPP